MGQLSLPRLEKISHSMTWESTLLYNTERWASPKLFILHKLLARYSFSKKVKRIRFLWNRKNDKVCSAFKSQISNQTNIAVRSGRSDVAVSQRYHVFSTYIYQRDNTYTTLVLYSCATSRNQTLQWISTRIKKVTNKINVTKQHPFRFL